MTDNLFNIPRSFRMMKERGWDKLYWAVDLHDTICPADYIHPFTHYYPYAKEVLQDLSSSHDSCLILFTSSFEAEINHVTDLLALDGIAFDYINENPEAQNTRHGDFSKKFYFNILLDDKAGFNGETDWQKIHQLLKCPDTFINHS